MLEFVSYNMNNCLISTFLLPTIYKRLEDERKRKDYAKYYVYAAILKIDKLPVQLIGSRISTNQAAVISA